MSVMLALVTLQAVSPAAATLPAEPTNVAADAGHAAPAGPPAPPRPKPKVPSTLKPAGCSTNLPTDPGVITVCAPTPDGYRIDPDILKAKQIAHNHTLPRKREMLRDNSCQVVGGNGCMNPPILNVMGAAMTAAKTIQTALTGGNVMKLLETDPQPSEYEIYLAAKADREAQERDAAAQAAALAAKAKRAAAAGATTP